MPIRGMRSGPPHLPSKTAAAVAGGLLLIKPADGIGTLRASLLHTFCSNAICFPFIRGARVPHTRMSPKSVKNLFL